MFSGASNFVQGVDNAFLFIIAIATFFLVGITIVMVYFVFRYSRKRNPVAADIPGNNTLEVIWTVIPVVLVLAMFWIGFKGFMPMRDFPDGAKTVRVIARMWSWTFEYPNGKRSTELFVPINEPVILDMVSEDVLHSLYIPAFRVKEDVVPGRTNRMWFIPQLEGTYDLYCAEYCGQLHAQMITKVNVMEPDKFEEWYQSGVDPSAMSFEEAGYEAMQIHGCFACHSTDGSARIGSTFKDLYGSTVEVVSGGRTRKRKVDDEYIRQKTYDPNLEVRVGYTPGLMPSYRDQITNEEMANMILYLKSISANK
jgi:cytochrome c oxidase subunit II